LSADTKAVARSGRVSVLAAAAAQALTAAVSIGQSLALLVIAGPGAKTAAFLGAYTIYLPVATLAATIRFTAVPMFARRDAPQDEAVLAARIRAVGVLLALAMVVVGPALGLVITRSLPGSARGLALVALGCLALAGAAQVTGAGYAARASARGRFVDSSLVYAAAGAAGLASSCVAILLIGAVGAALGVTITGVLAVIGNKRLCDDPGTGRRVALFGREQLSLVRELVMAAAMPVAVQLHLVLVLALVPPHDPDAITAITYAFLFVSLLLGASFQTVGGVGLAEVSHSRRPERGLLDQFLVRGLPAAFRIAAPIAVTALILGPHIARAIPTDVLARDLSTTILDYLSPMTVVGIPWGFQTILFSIALASGATAAVVKTIPVSFVVLAAVLLVLGDGSPQSVGIALTLAETVYVLLMSRAIFGGGSLDTLRRAGMGAVPVVAGTGTALAIGYHQSLARACAATVLAVLFLIWGVRQNKVFDAWVVSLRGA
jgi:hypothetical protein